MIYQNNSFSRTRDNEAKMGAYYTDLAHCRDIRKMLVFPEEEEVSVLEPSIGDASAVIEATGASVNSNIKIFGVELNDAVADKTAQNPYVHELLKADFTNGIIIRKGCFSFCFANPPYLNDRTDTDGEQLRLEKVFLERIINYLKLGGILVWIVQCSQYSELQHIKLWMRNFETLAMYRFRSSEYEKYKQVVVIGRKVAKHEVLNMDVSNHLTKYHLDALQELPTEPTERILVPPSPAVKVDLFTTKEFDSDAAYDFLAKNGLSEDIKKAVNRRVAVKEYADMELLRPAIPLKKDSLYLLATSGSGQGLTGSEETLDLHLQRGVAEVVEDSYVPTSEDDYGDEHTPGSVIVTSRTAITMSIIQNDGTISVLT